MIEELTIIYEPIEDGWWMATVAEYPGATSQGASKEEAKLMALDAMNELMLSRRERALAELGVTSEVIDFKAAS